MVDIETVNVSIFTLLTIVCENRRKNGTGTNGKNKGIKQTDRYIKLNIYYV
jgi:hypothetical protein